MAGGEAFSPVKIDAQLTDVDWNLRDGRSVHQYDPEQRPVLEGSDHFGERLAETRQRGRAQRQAHFVRGFHAYRIGHARLGVEAGPRASDSCGAQAQEVA